LEENFLLQRRPGDSSALNDVTKKRTCALYTFRLWPSFDRSTGGGRPAAYFQAGEGGEDRVDVCCGHKVLAPSREGGSRSELWSCGTCCPTDGHTSSVPQPSCRSSLDDRSPPPRHYGTTSLRQCILIPSPDLNDPGDDSSLCDIGSIVVDDEGGAMNASRQHLTCLTPPPLDDAGMMSQSQDMTSSFVLVSRLDILSGLTSKPSEHGERKCQGRLGVESLTLNTLDSVFDDIFSDKPQQAGAMLIDVNNLNRTSGADIVPSHV